MFYIFLNAGEKPFRCLFSTCLKRFRYKGDLSKHIKRYHPGHSQALTPVPLQDDEVAALANAQQQAASTKQKVIVVSSASNSSSVAPVSTLRTVLTTGLRPQQLVLQGGQAQMMQPPAYRLLTPTSTTSSSTASANPGTIIPDSDPSLDENLLNILAADGDEDDPMMSPSVSVKTLAGLNQSNTKLVLPNTVFTNQDPITNQDVGVFLQSSGKSSVNTSVSSKPVQQQHPVSSRPVMLTSSAQPPANQFVLPKSTVTSARTGSVLSVSSATSSQTLRSLLSSTPESLPMSQTLILSPINGKVQTSTTAPTSVSYQTATIVNPPPLTSSAKLSESYLPADILSGSGHDDHFSLDDIMASYPGQDHNGLHKRLLPPGSLSDRDSDLTSPGSVRSELTDTGRSEEGEREGPEKFPCQFPGCNRTFDRPNLLKRHLKIHSGECRYNV